jgi:hypothetical protein
VKRRRFNVLAVLSLILCIVVAIFYARSFEDDPARTMINTSGADESWWVVSDRGEIILLQWFFFASVDTTQWHRNPVDWKLPGVSWYEDGCDTMWNIGMGPQGGRMLRVSYLIPLSFCLFVALTMARLRRNSAVDATACLRCGYDLRATPDRCPECGTVTASGSDDPLTKSTTDEHVHGV